MCERGSIMTREFVRLPEFEKQCNHLGLSEDNIIEIEIENEIIANPAIGDLIQGTGGIRKLRIALSNRGKRSGARVIFIDFISFSKTYLITVYSKSKVENISKAGRNELRKYVDTLKDELRKKEKYE